MKIYQPMLFVGLGGTGNRIGAELERTLRRELCGPDGMALTNGGQRQPFELPQCTQFVYADFSEAELYQLPHLSAKGPEAAAYRKTARAIHDLLPAGLSSSTEVTRALRVGCPEDMLDWLPPTVGEPRVAPLSAGAGQLPSVGRAALLATLRDGLEPVVAPLREAIGAIAGSGGDLRELGGGHIRGCDVFVAFSVSGGTGAGIFYDLLHLVGREFHHAFHEALEGVKIYPLVVMPSAFPPEAGGGREAELNAGRALVDIARLVDSQNAPEASGEVGDIAAAGDPPGVTYPRGGRITLRPSTMQTAILFSRPVGLQPEDLRRSVTATVMSLIGTELGDDTASGRAEGDYQTFAAQFVNRAVERSTPSRSGVGYRGMSTSLAASLTMPVDDLAEIVAGRLLAAGVKGMAEGAMRTTSEARTRVTELFRAAGIGALWDREPLPIADPDPLPRGSRNIAQALRDRQDDMEDGLRRLRLNLDRDVQRMVEEFRPAAAFREKLGEWGPFQLEQVLVGQAEHSDRVARAGLVGMLDNRRNPPERPEHVQLTPPPIPPVRRPLAGLAPARWGDAEVQGCVAAQNAWYQYRANQLWHAAWKDYENRWRPALTRSVREVSELVRALRSHEEGESRAFAERRKHLFRDDRKGVSYLLPPQNNLRSFYDAAFERLMRQHGLAEGQDAARLLERMVDRDVWRGAFGLARQSPGPAVAEIKQIVERQVKQLFTTQDVADGRPLLPSLEELLRAAAGDAEAGSTVAESWLVELRSQLARLLPVGFVPDGRGPLKILIVHPQTEATSRIKQYLRTALNLPRDSAATIEFRPVSTDSITVVLLRSGMSLTDISEVGHVLRLWADAKDQARRDDALDWRQRLGYRDDWLASTEEDRQRILHRLLCMVWNDRVLLRGDPASPTAVRFRLRDGGDAAMTLRLGELEDDLSSWTGLLRAYERFALLDEGQIVDVVCDRLMRAQPDGLTTSPVPPSRLFRRLVHEVAPDQRDLVAELALERGGRVDSWLAPMRDFWEKTFEGALDLPFPGTHQGSAHSTLRELLRTAERRERHPQDDDRRARLAARREEREREERAREETRGRGEERTAAERPYGERPYGERPHDEGPGGERPGGGRRRDDGTGGWYGDGDHGGGAGDGDGGGARREAREATPAANGFGGRVPPRPTGRQPDEDEGWERDADPAPHGGANGHDGGGRSTTVPPSSPSESPSDQFDDWGAVDGRGETTEEGW
ncbi:Tubulin like [Streptomyces zhaozhouensis]|uniref:Tubulin like n=1 Tax=Streptomyces zhaozhouensis TaxID=1300267 RepID=A0A286DX51_9ACTN|nr:tubulin-like doman-containing protein [Streptomyces zhaozhouensis]SOD63241.1 Tubulin like [Streptomyces zhaozhouensis]